MRGLREPLVPNPFPPMENDSRLDGTVLFAKGSSETL